MTQIGIEDGPLLRAIRREGLDTVEGAFAYGRGEDLDKPDLGSRRRTRLALTDETGRTHELYLKRYGPEKIAGWLARCSGRRRGRSPATVEFENIRAVRQIGIPTMRELLCGEQVDRSGRRSYLIVTAMPGDALERCFEGFLRRHAPDGAVAAFTRRLAGLVAKLHGSGLVHRDLYASHVFLAESGDAFELYLIDLARVFSPRWRRFRWRVKDLAQLNYSMPPEWVRPHWDDFLAAYLGDADIATVRRYNRRVARKVARMTRRRRRLEGSPT